MLSRLRRLEGRRAWLTALGLGLLSAAALPPVHAVPVLLIAMPGLLVLVDIAPTGRAAVWRGACFGFGQFAAGLYWLTDPILTEADRYWWLVPFATPLTAFGLAWFYAVPCGLCRWASPGWRRVLVLASLWTLFDILRQFVLTGFPWNVLGTVWAVPGVIGDAMIQPASIVGVHGLTLATMILAMVPALAWRARVLGAAIMLAWIAFGLGRLATPMPADTGITLVLVQGNVPEGEKHDRAAVLEIFRRHLALTHDGLARIPPGAPSVVIWSETASPFLLEEDAAARAAIADVARPSVVLSGSVRFDRAGLPHNSMVTVLPDGAVGPIYDKAHLVPFGEYRPRWFPAPIQLVPDGFRPGPGIETLHVPSLPPFGVLICYEIIFPSQVADRGHRPDWLVNITNDAWFGDTSGPRQHLATARLRAVEEGLPVARAANTGITAVFDARGHETGRLALGETGVLVRPLPAPLSPTAFARWGLVIPDLFSILGLSIGLGWLRKKRPTRKALQKPVEQRT